MKEQAQPVSVRFDPQTLTELNRLAEKSGRSRHQVICRLLRAAISDPQYVARLGGECSPQPAH